MQNHIIIIIIIKKATMAMATLQILEKLLQILLLYATDRVILHVLQKRTDTNIMAIFWVDFHGVAREVCFVH